MVNTVSNRKNNQKGAIMSVTHRFGKLRGDKIQYPDGVGCCVWYPLEETEEFEISGMCFDFSFDDIDDFIALLNHLKEAEPDMFEE